tara:strand:+ start:408 stop:665 length:258 start_codon:yes stop_codon:yes gene_type:complete
MKEIRKTIYIVFLSYVISLLIIPVMGFGAYVGLLLTSFVHGNIFYLSEDHRLSITLLISAAFAIGFGVVYFVTFIKRLRKEIKHD